MTSKHTNSARYFDRPFCGMPNMLQLRITPPRGLLIGKR
jgi:hypothetical protein